MNRIIRFLPLSHVFLFFWCGSLFAEYTFVLKNGRRITVQNYREEGGTIKFYGLGGEIGIPRDQIQSIKESGEGEGRGMVFPGVGKTPPRPTGKEQEVKKKTRPSPHEAAKVSEKSRRPTQAKEKPLTPKEVLEEKKAQKEKEEKEYQKRVEGITNRIKALRDRYAIALKGNTSSKPMLLDATRQKALSDNLRSRLKDARRSPGGGLGTEPLKLKKRSPFQGAGAPPQIIELRPQPRRVPPKVDVPRPGYSQKEKKLSGLTNQLVQLEKQRKKLIEEMRRKNFDTSSLFLE